MQLETATLRLVQGDITELETDAIVNAANEGLRGGGGVDGAIHRAGGPTIMQECRQIGRCPTGEARVTSAGRLPAHYVIHTVGPIWSGGSRGEAGLLASAYSSSLQAAVEHGARRVTFPSLSTGAYGYPIQQAAAIALRSAIDFLSSHPNDLDEVTFVLFSAGDLQVYERALESLAGGQPT